MQRLAILATAGVFLAAALHNPAGWGRRVYAGLLALTLGGGIALSSRQVWLQYFHTGDGAGLCGMSLDYMLEVLSPWEIIKTVLKGTGDCTRIDWSFLGLSIPAWTLICFLLLAAVSITRNWLRD
jgi:disulfide bond formation protein DsbB